MSAIAYEHKSARVFLLVERRGGCNNLIQEAQNAGSDAQDNYNVSLDMH